eukprot:7524844-Pyramimonas_sp.AAC.1
MPHSSSSRVNLTVLGCARLPLLFRCSGSGPEYGSRWSGLGSVRTLLSSSGVRGTRSVIGQGGTMR